MPRLIDADELLKKHTCDVYGAYDDSCMVQAVFVPYIKGAPTIEATPVVHGRWIDMQEDEATEGMWRCSACDSDRYFDIMTPAECGCYYCPNCGAKMDLKREETN